MNRRRCLLAALGLSAAICSPLACAQTLAQTTPQTSAQPPAQPPPLQPSVQPTVQPSAQTPAQPPVRPPAQAPAPRVSEVKPLGQDRFQIGSIVVDKRAGTFTVPGRVHVLGKPLEYLATSKRGMKEYETLLELDSGGSEFNLACILLGLERDPKLQPFRQFSKAPLEGPRVALHVAWSEDGKRHRISAAEALLNPESGTKPESVEWVYTGSIVSRTNGVFAADVTGTLVGFVHDPNSIIEAATAVGIGAYGSVRGNATLLPPVGSAIELIVEVPSARK